MLNHWTYTNNTINTTMDQQLEVTGELMDDVNHDDKR